MSGSGGSGRTLLTIAPGHFVYDERVLRTVESGWEANRSYYAGDRELSLEAFRSSQERLSGKARCSGAANMPPAASAP